MKKTSNFRKPEYWLLILAVAGIILGTLATAGENPSPLLAGARLPTRISKPTSSDEAAWRIQDEENTVQVFESAMRGVVMVSTSRTSRTSGGRPAISRKGNGSGFFVDNQGHVVTNNHVVEEAIDIEVQTASGNSYKATVVGTDRLTDLAVLKVQAPAGEVYPLSLADYQTVHVGQKAIVLGSPLATGSSMGLDRSPTVTTGIISAKDRSMPIESPTDPNVNDYTIENLIQTDAAVNPGNSGGPLLNSSGEVVGVVTAIMDSANGIGFAIPSQVVADVVPQILKNGKVTRPFMGVEYLRLDLLGRDLGSAFSQLGLATSQGALVTDVKLGGPGEKAGLKGSNGIVTAGGQEVPVGGDIITSVDGAVVTGSNLWALIEKHKPGDKVKLEVLRGGQKIIVDLVLGSR